MKKQFDIKKLVLLNLPYLLMGLFATNFGEAWRLARGANASEKFLSLFAVLPGALQSFWPSLHPLDLLVGLCCGAGLRLAVYLKSKNAKKYRHGMEYGSARWGTREDIAPYIDPVFQNNVILTKTESLTMNSRPKDPKTARNKNVLVIGGSGSGKTRFWLKPNLMQMGNQVFQQNLDDKKGPQPGGPYLIQLLFKEPVEMPDKEKMTAVMKKHIGSTECFCYDKKMAGFAALDHIAEFQDGKCPVQLMVMKCDKFKGKGFDAFLLSQMWDCQEDRERIFRECRYHVVATDMLAGALPALERANLDADFLDALAELYPTCEAFYFQNCGKLFLADDVRSNQIEGPDRFIRFGVNVRFFNIEGTEDMLIDTVGMSTLFLPDLQYHFHGMDPNWVVNHAYNVASYILEHDNPIQDGETIDGVADGQMSRELQWKCQYEDAMIQPPRGVLDINMGKYASGGR